jgi:hypothetical protein
MRQQAVEHSDCERAHGEAGEHPAERAELQCGDEQAENSGGEHDPAREAEQRRHQAIAWVGHGEHGEAAGDGR